MALTREHEEFIERAFDPENHEKCKEENYHGSTGYYPRLSGVPKNKTVEDLSIGLMFIRSNYKNASTERKWDELCADKKYSDAVHQYHKSMSNNWFAESPHEQVIETINKKMGTGTEDFYITDYQKCPEGCNSDHLTQIELALVEHLDLWILFGNQPKNVFSEDEVKPINGGPSYSDGISKIHGYLYHDSDRETYILPLKFIGRANHSIRGKYYDYLEDGLSEYMERT